MREILNISISKDLNRAIDGLIKKGHYSTKSEFFRKMAREKIEEEDILSQIRKSETEIKAGKIKLLKSLADLD